MVALPRNRKVKPVIINGAGIAGLTAALCLQKIGIPTEIHEKSLGFESTAAGIQISPNAYRVFSDLGLGNIIRRKGMVPDAIDIREARSGKQITQIPLGKTATLKYSAPYLVIHRADIQEVLLQRCQEFPEIRIYTGSEVSDFAEHENGITAQVWTGQAFEESIGRALIIADGIHSKLSTKLTGVIRPSFQNKIAWRALIPSQEVPKSFDLFKTSLWLAPNSHAVTYPIREGSFLNVVAITTDENEQKTHNPDKDKILEHFSSWSDEFKQLFKTSAAWSGWPLYETSKIRTMSQGFSAIIGDAAHAMFPFAAQAGAMAIEDAAVIAHCMASQKDIAAAFRKYESVRLPRIQKVQKVSRNNGNIYHLDGISARARDLVMRHTPANILLTRQDWIYNWRIDETDKA